MLLQILNVFLVPNSKELPFGMYLLEGCSMFTQDLVYLVYLFILESFQRQMKLLSGPGYTIHNKKKVSSVFFSLEDTPTKLREYKYCLGKSWQKL